MNHLLPVTLAPIADIAATDNAVRFGATTGVKIDLTPITAKDDDTNIIGHSFTAVATDGRRLLRVKGECDTSKEPNTYPPIPALDSAPNGQLSAVVPAKDWTKAFREAEKLTRRGCKPILRNVAFVCGEQVSTLASTDLERVSFHQPRNLDGRFPAWEKVIPEGTPTYEIAVDPILLAELLTTMSKLAGDDHAKRVTMSFHQPDRPFVLRTHNPSMDALGIMVPLAGDKGQKITQRTTTDAETEIAELRAALESKDQIIADAHEELEKLREKSAEDETHIASLKETLEYKHQRIAELAKEENGQYYREQIADLETLRKIDADKIGTQRLILDGILTTLKPLANNPGCIAYDVYHQAKEALGQ